MSLVSRTTAVCVVGFSLSLVLLQPAVAQQRRGGFARMFGPIPSVTLAQLEEVQADLKLTEEQKTKVEELNTDLGDERRALFQNSGMDRERMRQDLARLYVEYTEDFNAGLDEAQRKRAHEIYLQVNGPVALSDEDVAKALTLSDDQKTKLEQVANESREKAFASFQEFQSLSDEERAKKVSEMVQARNDSLSAVLTEDQRALFETMKGTKLEVDLSKLPGPRR